MPKWILPVAGIIGLGLLVFSQYKDQIVEKAAVFFKENFSVRISGFKIHKIDLKGVEFRINAELSNTSDVQVTVENLKVDVFYVNNGSPSHLATTTVASPFNINARDVSKMNDIKVTASYSSILANIGIITATKRTFNIAVNCRVNGQAVNFSQIITTV